MKAECKTVGYPTRQQAHKYQEDSKLTSSTDDFLNVSFGKKPQDDDSTRLNLLNIEHTRIDLRNDKSEEKR